MTTKEKLQLFEWGSVLVSADIDSLGYRELGALSDKAGGMLGGLHAGYKAALISMARDIPEGTNVTGVSKTEIASETAEFLKTIQDQFESLFVELHRAVEFLDTDIVQLEWDRKTVMQITDSAVEPTPIDGAGDGYVLNIWTIRKGVVDFGYQPEKIASLEIDKSMDAVLQSLEAVTLDMFKSCGECGRVFFHWRKRDKLYCSKRCQNTVSVRRHREKKNK